MICSERPGRARFAALTAMPGGSDAFIFATDSRSGVRSPHITDYQVSVDVVVLKGGSSVKSITDNAHYRNAGWQP